MSKRLPLLITVLALAVWAGNFIIKNFLAVSLVAYGQRDGNQAESLNAAVGYAPANAEVLAARARYWLNQADPPRVTDAINDLRRAVQASPRDYRYQLELGKAYDANGQNSEAEAALQHAVELAPRYFETWWALANLRLRAGKTEPALDDFRQAALLSGSLYGNASPPPDRNATLNVYNAIAGALGMNLEALRRVTPPHNVARGYLAEFLSSNDAMDQAMEIWRQLPTENSIQYRMLVAQLTRELQSQNRFSDAQAVWQKFSIAEGAPANDENNLMANGGFEQTPLREKYAEQVDLGETFDWAIRRHPEVRVLRSTTNPHSGSLALHLTFNSTMNSGFGEISQLIAVEPSRQYRLSYFVKTKHISTLPTETPFISVTDALNPSLFNLRSSIPSGTNDWGEQAITFSVPNGTRGLRLTIHAPQLKTIDNLRIAEFWLDDFKLSLLGTHDSSVQNQ